MFVTAGIAGSAPLGSMEEQEFGQILKVNVIGVFFTQEGHAVGDEDE